MLVYFLDPEDGYIPMGASYDIRTGSLIVGFDATSCAAEEMKNEPLQAWLETHFGEPRYCASWRIARTELLRHFAYAASDIFVNQICGECLKEGLDCTCDPTQLLYNPALEGAKQTEETPR